MFWKVFLGVVLYLIVGFVGLRLVMILDRSYRNRLSIRFGIFAEQNYDDSVTVFTCRTRRIARLITILGLLLWPAAAMISIVLQMRAYKKTYKDYLSIEATKKARKEVEKILDRWIKEASV